MSIDYEPNNLKPGDPGAKLDGGKLRADLLDDFHLALIEIAKVCTYGVGKYSENGWLEVPDGVKRYRAAAARHRLAAKTEEFDPESGLRHRAHEAWNVLAALHLSLLAERGTDDKTSD